MYIFKDFIDKIIDLILPKDIEVTQIENMSEIEIFDAIPVSNDIKDIRYKALFQYKNKISRKAIWAIKYNGNQNINKKFANLLYESILEDISDETAFSSFNNPLLIPVPMHKNNLSERGFNQSELIVKEIIKIDSGKNFTMSLNSLTKIKETPHQSKLKNKSERLKNLNNCFFANNKLIQNRNIILIDDVITTGATMKEASKTLRNAGAKKVIGFALAH